ncbi:hypothetical protein MMC20_003401 [Loxospora ochrophaea]|nr:hypothetical protein [Loxospora ochrophaea]
MDSVLKTAIGELPLPLQLRCALTNSIWNKGLTLNAYKQDQHEQDNPFFSHYEDSCNLAISSSYGGLISRQESNEIVRIIKQLRSNEPRDSIQKDLIQRLSSGKEQDDYDYAKAADCIIYLVIRLWLMCHVGTIGGEVRHEQYMAEWDRGSLRELMAAQFPDNSRLDEPVQLEKQFQARNLEKLAGIQVLWTANLLDHLRVHDPWHRDGQMRVSLFYHVHFLEYHKESSMFPPHFIEETLRTFALLLPQYDSGTQSWFKKQCSRQRLDPKASQCGSLKPEERNTDDFKYWRDRLTILKQAYDTSEPKTVRQWWLDRRRRVQWATFWVAALVLALTVFFGLIQSIEGALQVYKAYHPS